MKKNTFEDLRAYVFGSLVNVGLFAATIFFIIVISAKSYSYGKNLFTGNDGSVEENGEMVEFNIPEESTPGEVATILKEAGLIDIEFVFTLQTKLNGTDRLIRGGDYKLPMGISSNDLMDELQKAPLYASNEEKITIKEGLSLDEMGEYIEKEHGFFTKEAFLAACKEVDVYDYSFIDYIPAREYLLEGYLFPDTYFLPENPTPQHLIARMLNRFEEIYANFAEEAENMGLTTDQVVTIASIIEKEIKVSGERELASGVIHRRLKMDMPLQMCSTVLYALETTRDKLSLSDLQVESDYNTYIHGGLPPGPIAAPGEASLEAAIFPNMEKEYLYFVLQNAETGEHYFTKDYDDFIYAKQLYGDDF